MKRLRRPPGLPALVLFLALAAGIWKTTPIFFSGQNPDPRPAAPVISPKIAAHTPGSPTASQHAAASQTTPTPAPVISPTAKSTPPLPRGNDPVPSSDETLQRRAARVEQEANHDLRQLVGLLELTEDQQDRIFATLARRSPDWHPDMQLRNGSQPTSTSGDFDPGLDESPYASHSAPAFASGNPVAHTGAEVTAPQPTPAASGTSQADPAAQSPTGSGSGPLTDPGSPAAAEVPLLDALAGDLTADQQLELANAELDRTAWWEEIITKLLPDSEVPALGDSNSAGTAAAAVPPSDTPQAPADEKTADPDIILD